MNQRPPTRWLNWRSRWQKVRWYYFPFLTGLVVMNLLLWQIANTTAALAVLQLTGSSLLLTGIALLAVLRGPQAPAPESASPPKQAGPALFPLIDSVVERVFIVDAEARILEVDEGAAALLGYAPPELVGHPAAELLPQHSVAQVVPLLDQLAEGETVLVNSTVRRKSGLPIPADLTLRRLDDRRIQVHVRGKAEGGPDSLHDDVLSERRSQLAALYDVSRALSETLDMQEIFRVMYRDVARRIFGAPHFTVALYNEATQMITCGYVVVNGEEADPSAFPVMPLGEGPNSECIRTRQPRHVDLEAARQRLSAEECSHQKGDERLPMSALYVPLVAANRVIAVFNMQRYEPDSLAHVDMEFVRTLASMAAVALANARLVAAEREEHLLTDALLNAATALISSLEVGTVMQRILEYVGLVVPHSAANIVVIEEEDTVRVLYSRGHVVDPRTQPWGSDNILNWPTFQTMLRSREPYIVSDTHQSPSWVEVEYIQDVASYLGMPIVIDEQVIGFINLNSTTPGFYTQAHARKLRAFAAQAALALQNARLYEEVRIYASQLQVLVAARTNEIDRERAQLNIILETMAESVIFVTGEQIVYSNPAFSRLTGYTQPELRSLGVPQLYERLFGHEDNTEMVRNEVQAFRAQRSVWQRELILQRKDGAQLDVRMTLTRAVGPGGVELGTLALLQDISRSKALQMQKDRFITHASHELRTPITNLKMRLYLLERAPEHLSDHLIVLKQTADILHHLVQDMLELTELQSSETTLQLGLVNVQAVINGALDIAKSTLEQRQITALMHAPAEPLPLLADQNRLAEAFINLMAYLAAVLPERSYLDWYVELQDNMVVVTLECSAQPKGFQTTGDVFDPFYQASEGGAPGTGLGLAIAREIIQLHGGEVGMAGEQDTGGVFLIHLPLHSSGISRQA